MIEKSKVIRIVALFAMFFAASSVVSADDIELKQVQTTPDPYAQYGISQAIGVVKP